MGLDVAYVVPGVLMKEVAQGVCLKEPIIFCGDIVPARTHSVVPNDFFHQERYPLPLWVIPLFRLHKF